jgi:diguanylate cyclase (GGDEF)-like protein
VLSVADVFDAYTSDRVECTETIAGAMQALREASGTFFDPEIVRVWESIYRDVVPWVTTSASTAYNDIQRVTSELKIIESFTELLAKLETADEISEAVSEVVEKRFPTCDVELKAGSHDGIPVEFENKIIGTITHASGAASFTDDEIGLIRAVAEKIGGPLSKAMALEVARRDASFDKLTGLANRRGFELACASLENRPVSVVLIDVNAFKAVNDNFGHKAGDEALVRIAAHIRVAFSDAYLTCRLGGDEFVVLSEVDNPTLRMQIRSFRRTVLWDPAHNRYRKMMFGVSCGLAAVPTDGESIEQAMYRADERMYAIKMRLKRYVGNAVAVTQ